MSTSTAEKNKNLKLQAKVVQMPPHLKKEILVETVIKQLLGDPSLLVMHLVHRQQILVSVTQSPGICCLVHEARLDHVASSLATHDEGYFVPLQP